MNLVDSYGNPLRVEGRGPGGEVEASALSVEQLRSALEAVAEEMFASGVTSTELELLRDAAGWQEIGTGGATWGISERTRTGIVRDARTYAIRDAASKRLVSLWTQFGIHKGIQATGKTDKAKTFLETFWHGKANRAIFNLDGQQISSWRVLTDGEVPFALGWSDVVNGMKVRRMDPLQIKKIITNPDDEAETWFYKREFTGPGDKEYKFYYRDIYAPEEREIKGSRYWKEIKESLKDFEFRSDASIYFVAIDRLGIRGNSLLTTVIEWTKAHRIFMKCRAAITRALAQFAWRLRVKGGATAVEAELAKLRSSLASDSSSSETNPPPAPGATRGENAGSTLDPISVNTGAGNAQVDGSMLVAMIGLGAGTFAHWLGFGESFKLATATQMELPMLKMFEVYQARWTQAYREIIDYAAEKGQGEGAGIALEPSDFDVEPRPLLARDVPRLIASFAKVLIQAPELSDNDDIREWLLTLVGVPEPKVVVEQVRKDKEAADAKAAKEAKENPLTPFPPGGNGGAVRPPDGRGERIGQGIGAIEQKQEAIVETVQSLGDLARAFRG